MDRIDPRRLGRVDVKGPMFGGRRRSGRRLLPALVAVGALVLVPVAAAGRSTDDPDVFSVGDFVPEADQSAAAAAEVDPAPAVFARFDGLALHLPSDDVLLVGYHEASLPDALPLDPVGDAIANENRTKFTAPGTDPEGPEYIVLSSRGRRQAATSAVDLVMRDDDPVTSLVTGRVTDVRDYYLYGRYPDTRIEIEPLGRPDLRVVLIHVSGVQVRAGDEVTAGETALAAGPNRFDFASHIDRYFPQERWPHVHIEVKNADVD